MKTMSPRGFIHIPTLLIVLGAVLIVGTTGYFAYKMGQSSSAPMALSAEAATTVGVATTTATTTDVKKSDSLQKPAAPAIKTQTKATVTQPVVIAPTVTPTVAAGGSSGDGAGSGYAVPLTIAVDHVGQNIYKYDSGTKYGAYGITLNVYAHGGDVLIPMTTTDSTKGTTGVSYSITGDYFGSGSTRDSKFDCSLQTTERSTHYCKVKDGDSTTITVTVWLTPYFSGSYGVRFDTLKAWIGGEYKTYNLGKETEQLYIER